MVSEKTKKISLYYKYVFLDKFLADFISKCIVLKPETKTKTLKSTKLFNYVCISNSVLMSFNEEMLQFR